MFRIQIKLQQISLRFKFTPQFSDPNYPEKIYLKFYLIQNGHSSHIEPTQPFTQKVQTLKVNHEMYVKMSQIKDKKLNYKIVLAKNQKQRQKKIIKNVGDCQVKLGRLFENEILPVKLQLTLPIKNCPDSSAYLRVSALLKQVQEFKGLLESQDKIPGSNQPNTGRTQLNGQKIGAKHKNQQLQQTRAELERMKSRAVKYKQEILRIKNQNNQLDTQIKQQIEAAEISEKLQADVLQSLISKNQKTQKEYMKKKQQISDIVNLINEYGRLDIVELVTQILAQNQ